MRNIIIVVLMFMLPSLVMAQGPVHRQHSVNGPKTCKECNRLRAESRKKEQERIAAQRRLEEQRRREREQRLVEERRREQERIAEEERRLTEERKRREEDPFYAEANKRKNIVDKLVDNMVYVSGGTFTMGATSEQISGASEDEKPSHLVTLSSYYIGKYEVTQAEWEAVMGTPPSVFKGDNLPVENVNWDDCQEFIRKLNSLTGKNFRLPTEAEWEFAARGGNNSRGYKYSGSNDIDSVAWYDINSGDKTHSVGLKSPNELGLYDMSGNVLEWCLDWKSAYTSFAQTNPTGPISGSARMLRGGGWCFDASASRVSCRASGSSDLHFHCLGLRLAM